MSSRQSSIQYAPKTGPPRLMSNIFQLQSDPKTFTTGKNVGGYVALCLISAPPVEPFLSAFCDEEPSPNKLYVVVKGYPAETVDTRQCQQVPYNLLLRQREAQNFLAYFPNLVRVYGADDLTNPTCIMTEYCEYGSLREVRVCQFPDVLAPLAARFTLCRAVGYQALMGLAYMHEVLKIMHRDINPKNLLIDKSGRLKIGDFLSSSAPQASRNREIGTDGPTSDPLIRLRGFRAPELPNNPNEGLGFEQDPEPSYDFKVDMYSLGLTLLELLDGVLVDQCEGEIPTTSARLEKLTKQILEMPDSDRNCYKAFVELLKKMTAQDRDQRPSAMGAASEDFFHPSYFPSSLLDGTPPMVAEPSEAERSPKEGYAKDYQAKLEFLKRWEHDNNDHVKRLYEHEYPYVRVLRQIVSQMKPYRPDTQDAQTVHLRFGSYLSDA